MKLRKHRLSHIQIIALGYMMIIACGTLLLMLPIASAAGESTGFTQALFTSTSASCVTGLVLCDTASYWSVFGQIVILLLIQVGGLGFMTIATFFVVTVRHKVGLREREVMVESINTTSVGGIIRITKRIVVGTVVFETAGALLLAIRFIPLFGYGKGIFYSVFHSISAFCNAGFDLMGTYSGEYSSLVAFADDPLINFTLMALVITGGIGFIVWDDIANKKFCFKRYTLHTKITLSATAILIFGGALLFLILEYDRSHGVWYNIITSLFDSVTARTAGFNTTDVASLSSGGKLLMTILMFIGGSSGSTAGGVKTSTIVVILAHTIASMRHDQCTSVFGRQLGNDVLRHAIFVFFTNLTIALTGTILITVSQNIDLSDIVFETFSAIGTVGLSTGITRSLNTFSQYIIIFLMYCGRVGSISFATALLEKRARPNVTYPVEKVTIG